MGLNNEGEELMESPPLPDMAGGEMTDGDLV